LRLEIPVQDPVLVAERDAGEIWYVKDATTSAGRPDPARASM